jgi:hypothetical protein
VIPAMMSTLALTQRMMLQRWIAPSTHIIPYIEHHSVCAVACEDLSDARVRIHTSSRCPTTAACDSTRPEAFMMMRLPKTVISKSGTSSTQGKMVELNGIEPMTSCLQSRRSPN